MFRLVSLSYGRRTLIYKIIVVLAFFSLGSDMIFYPGFFKKYLFVSPLIFFTLSLLFTLFLTLIYKKEKPADDFIFFRKINNYFLLPLIFALSLVFTTLEYLNYPNYIFSTFHIHLEHLFYLLVLNLSLTLCFMNKEILTRNKKYLIFGFSLFLIYSGIAIKSWQGGYFSSFIDEDGLFENLQFFFYLASSITAFLIALREYRKGKYIFAICFVALTIVMFFIAGEEISWGQRFLKIQSPEILVQYNAQREINIHNLNGINSYQYLYYMFVSLLCFSSWIIIKYLPRGIRSLFKPFIPPWYLTGYFLPIFFIYFYIKVLQGTHLEWREFGELLLALGFLVYFFEIHAVKS